MPVVIKQSRDICRCLFCRLLIRIRSDAAENPLKFGCNVTDAQSLLVAAQSLGIDVVGVSVHFDEPAEARTFQRVIAAARDIFDFAATLGFNFDRLDFGDGFPIEQRTIFDKVRQTSLLVLSHRSFNARWQYNSNCAYR